MRTEDGDERQVLIGIRKASAPIAIERFRRYLGQQQAEQERQRAQRAERELRLLLAQAIGRLHGLGHAEALAAAPAVDAEVRRVLSG